MTWNTQLSLAEGLYILDRPSLAEDILSYTLAELVMLDVIYLKTIRKKIHPNDPAMVEMRMVIKGNNFDHFYPEPHQEAFFGHLFEHKQVPLQILARQLVPDKNPKKFMNRILVPHLFNDELIYKSMGLIRLTKQGKEMRKHLKTQLKVFTKYLKHPSLNQEKLLPILQDIGPLILLAPRVGFEKLPKLQSLWHNAPPPISHQKETLYSWHGVRTVAPAPLFSLLDPLINSFEKLYMGIPQTSYSDDGMDGFDL